jgi:ABC-type Na+ transport system ATPase subunit NatA
MLVALRAAAVLAADPPRTDEVLAGEVVGVADHRSPGASAWFELLAGTRRPARGSVEHARAAAPRRGLVLLRATDGPPDGLDARESLLLYAAACGLGRGEAEARAAEALRRAGLPAQAGRRHGLGREARALVAVARGLVARPGLWLVAAPPGTLPPAAEALLATVAADVRSGSGAALLWALGQTAGARDALCDRRWDAAVPHG